MKKKVLLVFGGRSAEHEISLLSARNVAAALDKSLYDMQLVGISQQGTWYSFASEQIFEKIKTLNDKKLPTGIEVEACSLICKEGQAQLYSLKSGQSQKIDIAFPVMHGTFGEDGCVQGLFKMMNLPFVGCGITGSNGCMDKEIMKRMFKEANIPTARYVLLTPQSPRSYPELAKELGPTFFMKPASQGSSVGVHKVKNAESFDKSLKDAFLYDHKVLVEEFIEGQEVECAVLGHNHSPKASTCGEIIPSHDFYSYEAKYLDENGAALKIPAAISADSQRKIQDIAKKAFQLMGCEGLSRVDFFLKKNGEVIVNEINTLPGFTKISMYPKMWEATGLAYTPLISELIKLGFENFEREQALQTQFPGAKI